VSRNYVMHVLMLWIMHCLPPVKLVVVYLKRHFFYIRQNYLNQ